MAKRRGLYAVLAIEPGEGRRIAWLSLHSLFLGTFIAFYFSAANGLFLAQFKASALPAAYIVSGLAGYVTVALFSPLERKLSAAALPLWQLGFLIALVTALWGAAVVTGSRWAAFAMFVAITPCFTVLNLEFWGLATRLFDLRQGKRLFGLLGCGEVVSSLVGYFLVPLILYFLADPLILLPFAICGLAACMLIVRAMAGRFPAALGGRPEARRTGPPLGLADLCRNRYFLLVAALIATSVVANYLVDFSFLSMVRQRFPASEQVAGFIGIFFGVTKVIELLMKSVLAGRLLTAFGLRFGLAALPLTLLLCATGAALVGAWKGSGALFFLLVVLAKLVWLVLRKSLFDPSLRVLFQPLPESERLAFQSRLEGLVQQLSTGLAGLLLLALAAGGPGGPLALLYALLPTLAACLAVIGALHHEYRARLLRNLAQAGAPAPSPEPLAPAPEPTAPIDAPTRDLLAAAAAPAAALSEAALPELEAAFVRARTPEARASILRACEAIGGPRAQAFLVEQLHFPDRSIALQALIALTERGVHAAAGHEHVVKRRIEELAETAAWCAAALLDLAGESACADTRASLEKDLQGYRRTLYRLLSLLCDPRAVHLVRDSLENGSGAAAVYALEIVDLLVPADIKPLVLPWMESLSPAQLLSRLEGFTVPQRLAPRDRLCAILHRERGTLGAWTKACAIHALGALCSEVRPDLVAVLFHPDPVLQEAAAEAIFLIDPAAYARHVRKLLPEDRERLDALVGAGGGVPALSAFSRACLLRRSKPFATLPAEALLQLATAASERRLAPGEASAPPATGPASLQVILAGRLGGADPGEAVILGKGTPRPQAAEPTHLLALEGERLLAAVARFPSVAAAVACYRPRSAW
jgi:hypothetical protein